MSHVVASVQDSPLLELSVVGCCSIPLQTRFGPGQRNSYIVHYVISGHGWFNGQPISAGQGFYVTPGMQEYYYPDQNDPWSFVWFSSDDPKMGELFQMYGADPQTHVFSYDFIYEIKKVYDFVLLNQKSLLHSFDLLELYLGIFKLHIRRHADQNPIPASEMYVRAAVNYITANLSQPIRVESLTDYLGISQSYLFRVFKEQLGESPKQYILSQRLMYAKKLLTETNLSVTNVANSVGFPDVFSFSKFFMEKTGLSPKSYRKHTDEKSKRTP